LQLLHTPFGQIANKICTQRDYICLFGREGLPDQVRPLLNSEM